MHWQWYLAYLLNGSRAGENCIIEVDASFNMATATLLIPRRHTSRVPHPCSWYIYNYNNKLFMVSDFIFVLIRPRGVHVYIHQISAKYTNSTNNNGIYNQ